MKPTAAFSLLVVFFQISHSNAQVATWSLSREKWITQGYSNAWPLVCRFDSTALGTALQQLYLSSSGSTNLLTGTSLQMSYSTNVVMVSTNTTSSTNLEANFNKEYPLGSYSLQSITSVTNPITHKVTSLTNSYAANFTNDYPQPVPSITNIIPWTSLSATQSFQWAPLKVTPNDRYIAFYLLEGMIDTNMLASLTNGNLAILSNLTMLVTSPRLSAETTEIVVTNINPSMDHLALLEFFETAKGDSLVPVVQMVSSIHNVTAYLAPRLPFDGKLLELAITLTNGSAAVSWPTNAGTNLVLKSATQLPKSIKSQSVGSDVPVWNRVNHTIELRKDGRFQVLVPAVWPQRFFRLEKE